MEVRGRGQPAEAEVLSEETPGHGCQFLDGEEAEEPAASGLPPGRRLPSAATVGPRSRCSTEGQQGRNGNARSGEKTHEIQGGRWEERPGSWRHIIIFQDSKIKSFFFFFLAYDDLFVPLRRRCQEAETTPNNAGVTPQDLLGFWREKEVKKNKT